MNEPVELLVRAATDALRPYGTTLKDEGWRPELVVYAPGELQMGGKTNGGYAVALILPLPALNGDAA